MSRWMKPQDRMKHAEEVRQANAARKETGDRVRWRISWGQLVVLLILVVLLVVVAYLLLFHFVPAPNHPIPLHGT